LDPRNILVDRYLRADGTKAWKVTGIVNWRAAGYYPEYWEYTKAFFNGRYGRPSDFIRNVFSGLGDYTQELRLEKMSWEIIEEEDEVRFKKAVKECNIRNAEAEKEYLESLKVPEVEKQAGQQGVGN
jgi:hypothetical protein